MTDRVRPAETLRAPALGDVDVVFFDLGDTLVRAHPSWADVYLSAFPRFGFRATRDDLARALVAATKRGHFQEEGPFDATEEGSFERIKAFDADVLRELGIHDAPEAFFLEVEAAFAEREQWHIFPDVGPALAALDGAGYRLGVISNWVWGAPDLLHALELASHFEEIIISARVGYQKPHRAIFERALEGMKVSADRAVHVGDSYRNDVEGARAVGMRAILIERPEADDARVPSTSPPDDVPIVEDLFGVLDLLGVARPAATVR